MTIDDATAIYRLYHEFYLNAVCRNSLIHACMLSTWSEAVMQVVYYKFVLKVSEVNMPSFDAKYFNPLHSRKKLNAVDLLKCFELL